MTGLLMLELHNFQNSFWGHFSVKPGYREFLLNSWKREGSSSDIVRYIHLPQSFKHKLKS